MVRTHVGQPFDAPSEHGLLMALSKGRRPASKGNDPVVLGRTELGVVPSTPMRVLLNALITAARKFVSVQCPEPVARGTSVVYVLRLRSGAFYIGASQDLEQRLHAHASGRGGRTTRLDPPAALVRLEVHPTFAAARTREAQLKRWSRAKKEALIAGDLERLHLLSQSREPVDPR